MSKIHELAFNAEEIDELLDSVDKKTIYQDVTQSEHGLMSTTDKTKLDALPTAQQIDGALDAKVDKVEGKGLSKNDYTDADKAKVASALQSETDPTVPSWAKQPNKPSYNYSEIGNTPDLSGFITKSVNDLTNYYLKSETYTKAEVAALIGAIQQFHYEIYATLPQTGQSNVLYLIGPTGSGSDRYEEYVYSNNAFTKIGDTSIDLSGYVTTSSLNTALASYTPTSELAAVATSGSYNDLTNKPSIPDISGKADKVSNATNGNFAGLDSNGNITDSGSKASNFATAAQGALADTAYQKPNTGIPESDLSSDVQQALQKHFKGWYDSSSNLPANPIVGNYAYVKGATSSDPAAIYECATAGTWSDSGRTADTSNVQTFASGEEVNDVHIVKDLTTGGADDVLSAEQGVVLAEQIKQLDGYFYNINVPVQNNNQRNKNYTLTPGSKIAVRVSVVSGTSRVFNLNWIKPGGNEAIILGYPMGYITDVLTVPDDATGLNIFMTPAATGNVNKVEIFNASRAEYLPTRIGNEGLVYLDNRKVISKSLDVTTQNPEIDVISLNEARLTPLIGDIYAIISGTAKFKNDGNLRFWTSEDSASPSTTIPGAVLKDGRKIFKVFSSAKFARVDIAADCFESGGTLEITVFSIDSSIEKYNAPLYGRNIMCFGDSLTEYRMSAENKRYTNYLAELSLANVSNAGIGGTRLAQRLTPSLTPSDGQTCVAAFDICNLVTAWATNNYDIQDAAIASGLLTEVQQTVYETKLSMLKNNPVGNYDIVTIFGGTNDYTGGSSIGTADATNTDKGTIYGAINAIVSALLTAKPTLKIYFFSPIIRMFQSTVSLSTSSDVFVHSDAPEGKTLPQFCEVIADAVKLNHIPFCNWYWDFGWNVYNFVTYFGSDYTHPYNGFNVIADKMYKFLLSK